MPNDKQLLTVAKPTLLMNAVKNVFGQLGTGAQEQAVQTNSQKEAAAWEYAVASELLRLAKARKDQAVEDAAKLGVIPSGDREPGTHDVVYDGAWVQIMLKVNNPTSRVDVTAFEKALRDKRVKQTVIDECKAAATKTNKPPHQFSAVLRSARRVDAVASK